MSKKFSSIISFRIKEEEKISFQDACDRVNYIPSKYAMGNTLRKFISCYIQNPRYFENLFNKYCK